MGRKIKSSSAEQDSTFASPLVEIGGIGEIKENTVSFLKYEMRRSTDFVECMVEDIDREKIQHFVLDSIKENLSGNIGDVINESVTFSKGNKDDAETIIDSISADIEASIATIIAEEVNGAIEDLIEYSVKNTPTSLLKSPAYSQIYSPINKDLDNAVISVICSVKVIISMMLKVRIRDKINNSVVSIIRKNNEAKVTYRIKNILEKIANIIDEGIEEGLDYSIGEPDEYSIDKDNDINIQLSKISTTELEDDFIISVTYDHYKNENGHHSFEIMSPNSINRQDLLVSLCNLYMSLKGKSLAEQGEEVIHWCERHIFPYNFEVVMGRYNENSYTSDLLSHWYHLSEANMLLFKLKDFLNDLRTLTESFVKLSALIKIRSADKDKIKEAQKLLKKGNMFNPDEFFEEYGWNNFSRSNMSFSILNDIPKMQMGLRFSPENSRIVLEPYVNSVFDIAWYALIRMALVEDANKLTDGYDNKVCIAVCEACGTLYLKSSLRQKYCTKSTCQSARNSQKQKKYDAEKRKERKKKAELESKQT